VAAALAALAPGCFIDTFDEPPVVVISTGTALIDWTVGGSKARGACGTFDADTIRITVVDANGFVVGTFAQACEAYATTITLSVGSYAADALLIDAAGAPRTTTVRIAPFSIFGGDRVDIPIDFPANSFF
jgi:hypothetical protein